MKTHVDVGIYASGLPYLEIEPGTYCEEPLLTSHSESESRRVTDFNVMFVYFIYDRACS